MLQTLKWTESFFTGLAIVLIGLAVLAVPSNHVWGDPPLDPDPVDVGGKKACGGRSINGQNCVTEKCTDRKDCKEKKEDADKVGCERFPTGCAQCYCRLIIGGCGCIE